MKKMCHWFRSALAHCASMQLYLAIIAALVLTSVTSMGVLAAPSLQEEEPPPGSRNHQKSTQDDSSREVGVWYVVDYPPAGSGGSDLPATAPDALGLRNQLTSTCRVRIPFFGCISNWPTPSWISRFAYGNSSAWEEDWKRSASGGTEQYYVDSVDLAYFAGHGWTGGIIFGAGGENHDDKYLTYSDAYKSWGNRDLDWIGLAACNVLDNPNLGNWANTMDGLRVLMGFKTVMSDVPHGEWLGYYLRLGYTLPQAWFAAADQLQPQGVVARVIAEETFMYNDRWYSHDYQDYYDNTYWYWTHSVGSEPARYVDTRQVQEMPVYQVEPFALAEANQRWDTLGSATGVTTTDYITTTRLLSLDGRSVAQEMDPVRFSEDGKLRLDEGTGLFAYTETDSLWTVEEEPEHRTGEAMLEISATDAVTIAQGWLQNAGLLPQDAQFYEVVPDTLTQAASPDGSRAGSGVGAILQEDTTANQVVYSRILTYDMPATERAPAQSVEFSVMGPGSKLKVMVAPEVPANLSRAAMQQEAVVGSVGGYRQLQPPAARGMDAPLTVEILPFETVQTMTALNAEGEAELESKFALSYVPLTDIENRSVISNTLAYWEGPLGFNQSQLIPVHVIDLRNELEDSTVVTSTAYIPANPRYMAPLAQISSVASSEGGDLPDRLTVGTQLNLSATDATSTLAEAGYDAALNFSPGSGDYLYRWYVDSVAEENLIGSGLNVTYEVRSPAGPVKAGEASVAQTIILEVVDIGAESDAGVSTDSFQLDVVPAIYLPNVQTD